MVVMGNCNDLCLNQQFHLYMDSYLKAKNAFDQAADRYTLLDDNDFMALTPQEAAERLHDYDVAYDELKIQSLSLSAFVASFKDHIHFD